MCKTSSIVFFNTTAIFHVIQSPYFGGRLDYFQTLQSLRSSSTKSPCYTIVLVHSESKKDEIAVLNVRLQEVLW